MLLYFCHTAWWDLNELKKLMHSISILFLWHAGYRSVPLKNAYSEECELSCLLVYIDIRSAMVSPPLILIQFNTTVVEYPEYSNIRVCWVLPMLLDKVEKNIVICQWRAINYLPLLMKAEGTNGFARHWQITTFCDNCVLVSVGNL